MKSSFFALLCTSMALSISFAASGTCFTTLDAEDLETVTTVGSLKKHLAQEEFTRFQPLSATYHLSMALPRLQILSDGAELQDEEAVQS